MNKPEVSPCLTYLRYGGPEVLECNSSISNFPRAFHCLVRVKNISINPVDWKIMAGQQEAFTGRRLGTPRIFGSDFSGVVEAVGSGVSPDWIGKTVLGMVNPLVSGSGRGLLEVRVSSLCRCPHRMSPDQAAALPAAGISALRLFRQRKPGWWADRPVLLLGASGGVGHLLLQILVDAGARVCVASRKENHAALTSLGAVSCIDYREQTFLEMMESFQGLLLPQSFDSPAGTRGHGNAKPVLVDCYGSTAQSFLGKNAPCRNLLKEFLKSGGTWFPLSIANDLIARAVISMILPWTPGPAGLVLAIPSKKLLEDLCSRFEKGSLHPLIDSVWNLQDARQAISHSIEGHTLGKILIRME